MSLLPRRWARGRAWQASMAALLGPVPLPATWYGLSDPCALQYKAPSYDRRIFAELASGFLVPQNRPFPYVVTPRLVLLQPLDEKYRWSWSGTVGARFGDGESKGVLGARLHRSIATSASAIMPGLTIGLGPELVLGNDGGLDAVAEATVDLTPLVLGARLSWGPITFNSNIFSRPARLESFIGWRIFGWRRGSTPLEDLLHQPPPPRRRFRPQDPAAWHDDFQKGVRGLSDTLPGLSSYLSLVQQLIIRFGAEFDHASPDCGHQRTRLNDARKALTRALQQEPDSLPDVRNQERLEALLREQSQAFATSLAESVEYVREAEAYEPNPVLLAPAVMHAMACVLDGTLSSLCIRVEQ